MLANRRLKVRSPGSVYLYHGSDFSFMRGSRVRVIGKLDGGRVEVAPWVEREGRFSWVTSDPAAADLHPLDCTCTAAR
jgi:hypothetical protein